ncbi:MAG: imm11 family protein [Candidatus Sericytochromatia bacterium]
MIIYKVGFCGDYKEDRFMSPSFYDDDTYSDNFFTRFRYDFSDYKYPPTIYFAKNLDRIKLTKIPDFYYILSTPIFSERVIEVLGDILLKYGEYRILNNVDEVNTSKYYAYALPNYIDCLDLEKSDYNQHLSGYPSHIYNYQFIEDKLDLNIDIFHILYSSSNIFVSQRFVDKVIEAKLKNFKFTPIWSSTGDKLPDLIKVV